MTTLVDLTIDTIAFNTSSRKIIEEDNDTLSIELEGINLFNGTTTETIVLSAPPTFKGATADSDVFALDEDIPFEQDQLLL